MLADSVPVYDYQQKLLDETLRALLDNRKVLVQSPTGSGKTRIITKIIHGAYRAGKTAIVAAHLDEICDQLSNALSEFGIPHGRLVAGRATPTDQIVVASVQTMKNRLDQIEPPFFYFRDECHHATAKTDRAILEAFNSSLCAGMTATPTRLDGSSLKDVYPTMVLGPTKRWLIDNGYLVQPLLWAPDVEGLNLTEVDKALKNGTNEDIIELFAKSKIVGSSVEHYLRICAGAQFIAFCVSVAEAEATAKAFRAVGINAASLDGKTHVQERRTTVERFRQKRITGLVNVGLFYEGFDVPGVECVIHAKPTRSLSAWEQANGRAMRADRGSGKDHCKIIDMAGNWEREGCRLGKPDTDRDWWPHFLGAPKRDTERAAALARCPNCHYVGDPFKACPDCGEEREIKERKIAREDGQLTLITDEKVLAALEKKRRQVERQNEVKSAKTRSDVERIARERGYSSGWVDLQMSLKRAKYAKANRWQARKTK